MKGGRASTPSFAIKEGEPMSENVMTGVMPILALRGLAVFPNQTVHFDVGREKSVRALESAMKKDQ